MFHIQDFLLSLIIQSFWEGLSYYKQLKQNHWVCFMTRFLLYIYSKMCWFFLSYLIIFRIRISLQAWAFDGSLINTQSSIVQQILCMKCSLYQLLMLFVLALFIELDKESPMMKIKKLTLTLKKLCSNLQIPFQMRN
jgi:hypothetical protein